MELCMYGTEARDERLPRLFRAGRRAQRRRSEDPGEHAEGDVPGLGEAGADASLAHWERTAELEMIAVPTLVIGAQHDTMDPAFMEMMAGRLPQGRYLHCPDGSHMAMYDDQAVYFAGLIDFLHGLVG